MCYGWEMDIFVGACVPVSAGIGEGTGDLDLKIKNKKEVYMISKSYKPLLTI